MIERPPAVHAQHMHSSPFFSTNAYGHCFQIIRIGFHYGFRIPDEHFELVSLRSIRIWNCVSETQIEI